MFYHLNGVVSEIKPNMVIIDCNGMGFAVNTTTNSIADIKLNESCKLYVFDYIKEDCFDLYGFSTVREKRSFELLLSVSGVGPKAAISILSSATPEMFAMAIMNNDVKILTAAPGVGKKIAQRIILELKDKIAKETEANSINLSIQKFNNNLSSTSEVNDAIQALIVLGYSSDEINLAIKNIDISNMNVEQIIKASLKQMVK